MSMSDTGDQKERLAALDSMRAVAILMVVGVHALGYCRPLPEPSQAVIKFIVHTISVPVFFLVDGYLFARMNIGDSKPSYTDYVKKSMIRLLLPWLFFTIGYSVIRYIFELNGFFDNNLVLGKSALAVAKNSYGSVIAPQLYFLFSLFLIRLIAPLTGFLFKIDRNTVLAVGALYILFYRWPVNNFLAPYLRINGGQEPILHAFWGMQFYLVGIILYLFKDSIDNTKTFYLSVALFFLSFVTTVPENGIGIKLIVTQYLYLFGFYFGFSLCPRTAQIINSIGTNTMGIYLLHAPIMLKAVSLFLNPLVATPILSYLLLVLIVFGSSYALTISVRRIPYGSLLFGISHARTDAA
jgi:surface polysaccharide O-acyltransferase-like enzyme